MGTSGWLSNLLAQFARYRAVPVDPGRPIRCRTLPQVYCGDLLLALSRFGTTLR